MSDWNDLRQEIDRLERIIQAPLSLKDLEVAWEAAEVSDECREGDVLIMQDPAEGYSVWRTGDADYLSRSTRILSRAPKREPHENLADAIREVWPSAYDEIDIGSLAYALHERGVRVTGGEES